MHARAHTQKARRHLSEQVRQYCPPGHPWPWLRACRVFRCGGPQLHNLWKQVRCSACHRGCRTGAWTPCQGVHRPVHTRASALAPPPPPPTLFLTFEEGQESPQKASGWARGPGGRSDSASSHPCLPGWEAPWGGLGDSQRTIEGWGAGTGSTGPAEQGWGVGEGTDGACLSGSPVL